MDANPSSTTGTPGRGGKVGRVCGEGGGRLSYCRGTQCVAAAFGSGELRRQWRPRHCHMTGHRGSSWRGLCAGVLAFCSVTPLRFLCLRPLLAVIPSFPSVRVWISENVLSLVCFFSYTQFTLSLSHCLCKLASGPTRVSRSHTQSQEHFSNAHFVVYRI